jgi:hypothetical protein
MFSNIYIWRRSGKMLYANYVYPNYIYMMISIIVIIKICDSMVMGKIGNID